MRPLLLLLTGLVIGLVSFNWGRSAAGTPHSTPPAAPAFDWATASNRDLNIAKVFLTARDVGVTGAMDSLERMAGADSALFTGGHVIAHALGRLAIASNKNDPSVLSQCRPTFQAGCYHGVLEGYLTSLPRVDAPAATRLCTALETDRSRRYESLECAHGLGHGFIESMSYNLAGALGACDAFGSSELRRECHDGVFMENTVHGLGMPSMNVGEGATAASMHTMEHGVPATGTFRASDPQFPCDSVASQYQQSCWGYQPLVIAKFASYDYAKTLAGCAKAPASSLSNCYRGVGKQSVGWFGFQLDRVAAMCATAGSREADCLDGGVEVLVDFTLGSDLPTRLCREARADRRAGCFTHVGARMSRIHSEPSSIAQECALAGKKEFIAACVRGSNSQ